MRLAECHPDRTHLAKGLCKACYLRKRRELAPVREQRRAYSRKYHAENAERIRARVKAWREANRAYTEIAKESQRLKKEYAITLEQYTEMLEAQGFACKICLKPRGQKKLNVDHCHATGKVRGLLCQQCNSLLGMAHDDPTVLQAAITYLEKNR